LHGKVLFLIGLPVGICMIAGSWLGSHMAIKKGSKYPNRYIIMSGDIDSRISDPLNGTDDSPGANDNASGMAGVIEAARVLSKYEFESSIIFVGLSGEEQGLFGGKIMAQQAKKNEWDIIGILNNDMIGNIKAIPYGNGKMLYYYEVRINGIPVNPLNYLTKDW
jgi:Zn-dependent M28 family amino/carboxypeptidase